MNIKKKKIINGVYEVAHNKKKEKKKTKQKNKTIKIYPWNPPKESKIDYRVMKTVMKTIKNVETDFGDKWMIAQLTLIGDTNVGMVRCQ